MELNLPNECAYTVSPLIEYVHDGGLTLYPMSVHNYTPLSVHYIDKANEVCDMISLEI